MTRLKREHVAEITEILNHVVGYTAHERKGFLILALQGTNALQRVALEGPLADFTPNLIQTMLHYGEVEPGKHALWAVLETAKGRMGVDYGDRIEVLRPHIEALSSYPIATPKEEHSSEEEYSSRFEQAPAARAGNEISPLQAARDYVDRMKPIPPRDSRFLMSSCLVSNELYYYFLTPNNSARVSALNVGDRSYLKHWFGDKPRQDLRHLPVTNITFRAATAFADWLSHLTSSNVRLPRLKEWEIAASAGRSNWFKEEIAAKRVNYYETAGHLHSVDAFNPNPYGIRVFDRARF